MKPVWPPNHTLSRSEAFVTADSEWEDEESAVWTRMWDDQRLHAGFRDEWSVLTYNSEAEISLYHCGTCVTSTY
jgi:hypothetical protein